MSGGGLNQRKHWSIKAHESLIRRNAEGNFCLNIEGGAENGLMPFIGEIRQDKIHYEIGKLAPAEILLEVNGKRVAGMIKKDVIALIKRSADPVSLVTVKQSESIERERERGGVGWESLVERKEGGAGLGVQYLPGESLHVFIDAFSPLVGHKSYPLSIPSLLRFWLGV